MRGSFKATFSGAMGDISLLTSFVQEAYPEFMAVVEYPDAGSAVVTEIEGTRCAE